MDQPVITMKDANGQYVCIKNEDLNKALLKSNFRILGLSFIEISRLRQRHMSEGFGFPVSEGTPLVIPSIKDVGE